MQTVTIPSAQYIRYPTEYHQIMSYVDRILSECDNKEEKTMIMPEYIYLLLASRNLLTDGMIRGVSPKVLSDFQFQMYLRDVNKQKTINS